MTPGKLSCREEFLSPKERRPELVILFYQQTSIMNIADDYYNLLPCKIYTKEKSLDSSSKVGLFRGLTNTRPEEGQTYIYRDKVH